MKKDSVEGRRQGEQKKKKERKRSKTALFMC